MNENKEKMPVRYKRLDSGQGTDFNLERSLDLIFSPGCFTVEIDHSAKDVGLPIEFCGSDHYIVGTLMVTDNGVSNLQSDKRLTGQVLIFTSRKSKETKVYTRTYADGLWSEWSSLVRAGMYNNISTTDELLATVGSLVNENTRAKEVEESVKRTAVDISSLTCTADKESVTITANSMDGEVLHSVEIPSATTESAGIMSAEEKVALDDSPKSDDIPMLLRMNYYNPDDVDMVEGKFLDLAGKFIESSNFCVTGYIPLNSIVRQLICTRNGEVDTGNGGAIAFYDKNKELLFCKQFTQENGVALWEPEVAYVRFSVRFYTSGHIQIELGDKYTSPIGYNENIWNIKLPNGYVETQSMSQVFGVEKTLNLLNPDELQMDVSAYISNGELKFTSTPALTASGFIEVKPLTTYTFWYSGNYFFLDADKKVIGGKNDLAGTATVTTPEDCRYLVINFYNERSGLALYNLDATARVYEGDVLYPYIPYGVASDKIQTYLHQQSISSLGNDGLRAPRATVAANTSVTVNSQGYPHSIKNNQIVFYGKFDAFGTLTIGRGFTNNAYSGCRFEITGTAITLFKNDGSWMQQATVEHGLTINSFIKVLISERKNKVFVLIQTLTGSFEHEFDYWGANGVIAFKSSTAMIDTVFSLSNPSFKCPVWMFGDSYYGADTENRQLYWLRKWGYDNTLVQSFGGQGSNDAYLDLLRCLDFGTPKYLVWSLGMNDDNSGVLSDITTGVWYTTYQKVKKICEAMDIELILTTIPEVRGGYPNKDAISEIVRNSGLRYIDAAKAVGSNSNGEWYGNGTEYDYQSSDNVHPSKYGAKAIATQFLVDFPEIMQY